MYNVLSNRMTTYLTYDEAKVLLDKSDDSAFLVRKMKECDEEEYEICLRYICIVQDICITFSIKYMYTYYIYIHTDLQMEK